MTIQPGANLYTQGYGSRPEGVEVPRIDVRNPTSSDINYPVGKRWINSVESSEWSLGSISASNGSLTANWIPLGGAGAGQYPISPYVVGPLGQADYQTIQDALNQANKDIADGKVTGATIYVQAGTYAESLTLYDKTSVVGVIGYSNADIVIINGTHTPPSSGSFSFRNVTLQSSLDIISSSAVGTANLTCENCNFNITNGYVYNLANWTGTLQILLCVDESAGNALAHLLSTATLYIKNSQVGSGAVGAVIDGTLVTTDSIISTPITIGGSSSASSCVSTQFTQGPTVGATAKVVFDFCSFITGTNSALTVNTSTGVDLNNCYINSSAGTTIAGSGALKITSCSFESAPVFSGTLTQTWGDTITGSITAEGNSVIGGTLYANTMYATADSGGSIATVGFTFTNTTSVSTGTGTIKMASANSASSSAWIKIYIGTTAYYIPCFSTDAP